MEEWRAKCGASSNCLTVNVGSRRWADTNCEDLRAVICEVNIPMPWASSAPDIRSRGVTASQAIHNFDTPPIKDTLCDPLALSLMGIYYTFRMQLNSFKLKPLVSVVLTCITILIGSISGSWHIVSYRLFVREYGQLGNITHHRKWGRPCFMANQISMLLHEQYCCKMNGS